MRRRQMVLSLVILTAVCGFVVAAGLAFWFYPGGTVFNRRTVGHHFWLNFLCDVMDQRALNGQPNGLSSTLLIAGVGWIFVAGLLPLWWGVAGLVMRARMQWLTRILGLTSLCGVLMLLASGWGWISLSHHHATMAAALPGFGATTLVLIALHRSPQTSLWLSLLGALMVAAAGIDIFVYMRTILTKYPLTPIVPIMQRVVLLLVLAWLLRLAHEVRQLVPPQESKPLNL